MRHLLIVDDERGYRDLYEQVLGDAGFATESAADAAQAFARIERNPPSMVISDVRMPGEDGLSLLRRVRAIAPGLPFLLITAYSEVRDAVAALKLGAVDYLAKPVDLDALTAQVRTALGVPDEGRERSGELDPALLGGIVAESGALREVLAQALRVAASDATVLLTGESGAGKEVVAQLVHRQSRRASAPLICLNCAAVPPDLLASELFGHERGAFTGASAGRAGRFRQAHEGSLFLDEIGEIPPSVQPLLLRALEARRITPLGSDREIDIDVRIVAATNRNLEDEIAAGRFRADLYHRLNVIALTVPPLRERPEDVLPLARYFLARASTESYRLSPATADTLLGYRWPGNVRELANAMERARLLVRSDVILPEHLPGALRRSPTIGAGDREEEQAHEPGMGGERDAHLGTLEASEIELIRRTLNASGGNRSQAAQALGISRRGLLNKIKRHGL